MFEIVLSILGIYGFIVMGYVAKALFKEQIDDKTITLLNVYFLQVFLTFWGLLVRPIDFSLFVAPSIYLLIILFAIFATFFIAKKLFFDPKERSIATIAALIGNTGNLGIPLNIAIFGEASIPYTTIINLMNVFVVYTLGVYFYSRGNFSPKESLKNILKLPILYAAFIAIALSLLHIKPPKAVMDLLMMGAYASMTMQLFLFGIYLYGVKIIEISKKLVVFVFSFKFFLLPLLAFSIIALTSLNQTLKGILFIELMMPLAVANVNLASLYDCKPKVVTSLVFITSLAFLAIIFLTLKILEFL